ncbi:exodeoxyribonuclease VII large subunit [Paenibacillus sp. MMS18-CY102]|uniref:exodeoxyribonuclease VII large subunit n=1 Tax=Paenibacillus sp. MMS18-CY102 TaxID=2682849 RepID=UPI0013655212|nr:exodeoxyribonuclease VII large subunit [Paenibacillus sp. MMS18-CY102]MWC28371.1 exodeoxyribonuclease VII large subunit [Paenibacillus sp. MMS18-CY102]
MSNAPHIYSIKELNRYIKMKLEADKLLGDVWLRGEISNFTHHSSGHMYFTLKDRDSRLKCIMFASHNRSLPFIPKEGTKVIARGNISVYERDGNYQYYVTAMQPDGIGSLYLAYEQLKKKLEDEGLFDAARKRQIPTFPRAIGVITSPTGAAVRDVIITLQRRHPSVPIIVCPVLVQGAGAGQSIVQAIQFMNRMAETDVLIVGRGGGSLEELWAFNEEAVARAIANSAIPIISAVGHETDFTIADFVSDLRAATPTAAAELAVPHMDELKRQLDRLKHRLLQSVQLSIRTRREQLERVKRSPFFIHPRRYLLDQAQRLDRLEERLTHLAQRRVERGRNRLMNLNQALSAHHPGQAVAAAAEKQQALRKRMEAALATQLKEHKIRLTGTIRQLDALSPLKVMSRGYSLVYDEQEQKLIRSVAEVQPGDLVRIKLKDGQLDCHVWSMRGDEQDGNE